VDLANHRSNCRKAPQNRGNWSMILLRIGDLDVVRRPCTIDVHSVTNTLLDGGSDRIAKEFHNLFHSHVENVGAA
jgi:hypothetical protein